MVYIKLSVQQKDEIRRLTQRANRRINSFLKLYEEAGYKTIPKEVTAGLQVQTRQQFHSDKYAISRSVKFTSQADYKKHLAMLKRFDPKMAGAEYVPTVSEYNKISRSKLIKAIETSGYEMSMPMKKQLSKLKAPEISTFWKRYANVATRMAAQYSSEAAMLEAMSDEGQFPHVEVVNNTFMMTNKSKHR